LAPSLTPTATHLSFPYATVRPVFENVAPLAAVQLS
jgi:hypothetical protein